MMAAACIANAYSQVEVTTNNKFFDNWYGGVLVGTTHSPVFDAMRPNFGLELGKQITPVLGVSVQGITGINSTYSRTAFDDLSVTLNGKLNLMNLFGGYKGSPRLFEIEGVFGAGFMHQFYNSNISGDNNMLTARGGASLNFNVGKEKQWTLSLRPACIFDVEGNGFGDLGKFSKFELMAGVVYHFKGVSGGRHHGIMTAYDQDYVDNLNGNINDMRKRNAALEEENANAQRQNEELTKALNDCNASVKELENSCDMSIEPVVAFRQGKDKVDVSQLSNIESIANFMKKNSDVKLDIKGYASPEGNAEFNQKLSEQRAYNVKDILVNKYEIEADRISAQGMGVGDNFSKPEMNRAIIAKFYK